MNGSQAGPNLGHLAGAAEVDLTRGGGALTEKVHERATNLPDLIWLIGE
jgi:hypothetical protein